MGEARSAFTLGAAHVTVIRRRGGLFCGARFLEVLFANPFEPETFDIRC